jgi:BRCT domain type II-containing protein
LQEKEGSASTKSSEASEAKQRSTIVTQVSQEMDVDPCQDQELVEIVGELDANIGMCTLHIGSTIILVLERTCLQGEIVMRLCR